MSETLTVEKIQHILEAALMAYDAPMTVAQLAKLFDEDERPDSKTIKIALENLQQQCDERGVELKEVASGFRYQAKQDYSPWLKKLWEERPPRYSRAMLETIALIAYRQPITRAEIEEVRGVAVSSNIIRSLTERGWVEEVGHRDVPGKPTLLGTTKQFLDYFNLQSLSALPTLQELADLDLAGSELEKQMQLLQEEQKQAALEADKAAADVIEQEIELHGVEMLDEDQLEQEITQLEEQAMQQLMTEQAEQVVVVTDISEAEQLAQQATNAVEVAEQVIKEAIRQH
jgi:segregation and condensation protein B